MAITTNLLNLKINTLNNKGLFLKDRKYKFAEAMLEEIKKLNPEDIMDDLEVVFDDHEGYAEIFMTVDYRPKDKKLNIPEAGIEQDYD